MDVIPLSMGLETAGPEARTLTTASWTPACKTSSARSLQGPVRRHLQVPLLTFEDDIFEAKATAGDTHLGDENLTTF